MRKSRTIYFNDARHYYLFVHEPPISLEEARRPIDDVAETPVDTFVYGVARVDGLYYPSRVGTQFRHGEHGPDSPGFQQSAYWRTWHNMKSLEERGLDPLRLLVDRAHERGMEFFASLRLSAYAGMDPALDTREGGRGWLRPEIGDFQFQVLQELAVDYPTDGIELDFAAPPMGAPTFFRDEQDAADGTPGMTAWVERVAGMAHGAGGQVGARVYPTLELNRRHGLDILAWLDAEAVDWVVPMIYAHNLIDPNLDLGWLVEPAHRAGASVYAKIQPYYQNAAGDFSSTAFATPAMMRAAVASYWDQDVDGMYTWFLRWPHGPAEHRILADMAGPEVVAAADKHYCFGRQTDATERIGFATELPATLPAAGGSAEFRFRVADDTQEKEDRQVLLKLYVAGLIAADRLALSLNGNPLDQGNTERRRPSHRPPYHGLWIEMALESVRPVRGWNRLRVELLGRPDDLISELIIEQIELAVQVLPGRARAADSSP